MTTATTAYICALVAVIASQALAWQPRYDGRMPRNASAINVHLIAHSHDDVGWLKNVDEYYGGLNNGIQRANVRALTSSVVNSLQANPDRKFIIVEQAFFQRWWSEQSTSTQAIVKQLVAKGQLEFINGGWCMHDETDNTFAEQIDQTSLGHRFLKQEFGVAPKATWQIDPWGHTAFQATYMSSPLAGFTSIFYGRIDWADAEQRRATQTTEAIWAPSASLGLTAATLGGLLPNVYQPPSGFDMSINSNDDPIQGDPTLTGYNLPSKVDAFVAQSQSELTQYRGNDIIVTMGSDFNYENAETWFQNLDALIAACNADGRLNVFYSTPSIYAAAKLASVPSWPLTTSDYVPYSEYPHAFHTGSFTSRASLKGYVRESSSIWAAARFLQAVAARPVDTSDTNPLYALERALGVAQHHDAVAGTSKQAVAYDYAMRIAAGRATMQSALLAPVLANLTGYTPSTPFVMCDLMNATICPALESANTGNGSLLLLFNSQAQVVNNAPVMLPVPSAAGSYAVFDSKAQPVTAQLVPLSPADTTLRTTYYNYTGPAVTWLAFTASLPAGGYGVYFIQPVPACEHTHASTIHTVTVDNAAAPQINNSVITLTFDASSGLLASFADTATGASGAVTHELRFYNASAGNWNSGLPAAGAYFMRPSELVTHPIASGPVALTIVSGPVVSEARQVYATWAHQTYRLWTGGVDASVQWDVGPVDVSDGIGKEIMSIWTAPGMVTNATWYTDSNGRDTMKRVRDYRPTWNYTALEPIAGNFYPVNIGYIHDGVTALSVVTDRAQGAASIQDGELELLIQRRLLNDDRQGVGEPLNEPGLTGSGILARGVHRFALAPVAASAALRRGALADSMWRPLASFAPLDRPAAAWVKSFKASFTGLTAPLPPQLHLLTAHALSQTSIVIRVSHSYETGEDAVLSQPASVDLATLFAASTVSDCVEMTVTANQPLANVPPVKYTLDNGTSVVLPIVPPPPAGAQLSVTLGPMQIRTFSCSIA